jgi:hypothetical protein
MISDGRLWCEMTGVSDNLRYLKEVSYLQCGERFQKDLEDAS